MFSSSQWPGFAGDPRIRAIQSQSNPIQKGEWLCAAWNSTSTEPDMRGYAAIVEVFRQKR